MNKKFKIIISYPPLKGQGTPLLSQNRQFQFFKDPTYIYPVVPASAATILKETGFEVIWNDCIAEGWDYDRFLNFIKQERPDLIAFETKTPVVKQHWQIIDDLKKLTTDNWQLVTALFGDHVTALPEESFRNSKVDYVITGGDYDFLLLNLCKRLRATRDEGRGTRDELEPGIWYREKGQVKNTGKFQLNHDLNSLPVIDRDLTKWKLYAYKNGNYKRTPGAYIMSGRDCWWGQCTFCSWVTLYKNYRIRKPELVADEIEFLIKNYSVKTIFDDTGTFPIGNWLRQFCQLLIEREYNKKIDFSCNARFGSLRLDDYKLMKKAGFRMLLFGLESANQNTLDRLKKNLKAEDVIKDCESARRAGLFPHITIMFGYPWETYEEAKETLRIGSYLLKKGYAYTVQATVVIPYPGSALFEECKENGWLNTDDWSRFDMKAPVMKVPMSDKELLGLVREIYKVGFNPEFMFNRILSVKDLDDLKYFTRAGKKIVGHIMDFKK